MGIGGEYAAINSVIDEMIPAKYRGRVDLAVNGTYWACAFLGTLVRLYFLNHLSASLGWRIAYIVGPVLALVIIHVRRKLPESPRWLIMHGRAAEAEAAIAEIESDVAATRGTCRRRRTGPWNWRSARPRRSATWPCSGCCCAITPSRSVLGAALMITQSFLYNAIFFTYGLVLEFFFHVKATDTAYYFMAFAAGNLLGPLTIGRLFDTIGRRKMISGTYLISGILLIISTQLFKAGALTATTQTTCWSVIFFFASPGARDGYRSPPRRGLATAAVAASARPVVPVAGVALTYGQGEYSQRRRHDMVTQRITGRLGSKTCATVQLETRLDIRDWRLCSITEAFLSQLPVSTSS